MDVVVWRKGAKETVAVKLGRLEDGERQLAVTSGEDNKDEEQPTKSLLGLQLSEISDEMRKDAKLPDDLKGLLIMQVEGGTPAEDKGIMPGEVVVQIGQEPVISLKAASEQVDDLKAKGRKTALLMVSSGTGDVRFVVVPIE